MTRFNVNLRAVSGHAQARHGMGSATMVHGIPWCADRSPNWVRPCRPVAEFKFTLNNPKGSPKVADRTGIEPDKRPPKGNPPPPLREGDYPSGLDSSLGLELRQTISNEHLYGAKIDFVHLVEQDAHLCELVDICSLGV